MIEQMSDLPAGALGFRAHGQVTADDFKNVIMPDIEAAFALYPKLRVLFELGPDFTGFDPGAVWDEINLRVRHISGLERLAVVTDIGWLRPVARLIDLALPGEVRVFPHAELDQARRWVCEGL
ncbi:STAS/SEC14 domain-containing protein [Aerosticca soli]|jgi:hypothetical protein|uniref:Amidases related to nicotinamidase n=1 Tax=Aerosticca soli TaxID=2010829 RepID=A0A2Z6E5K0_9GAMM|nr:STAS/SEC14 domain-containing protein [Aerosticca soli]MDI3261548.1 STAS/SEC14 domain-containing protein [Fulvimonas sp.]BBD79994.1 predicted protein [Aerosticca soli]